MTSSIIKIRFPKPAAEKQPDKHPSGYVFSVPHRGVLFRRGSYFFQKRSTREYSSALQPGLSEQLGLIVTGADAASEGTSEQHRSGRSKLRKLGTKSFCHHLRKRCGQFWLIFKFKPVDGRGACVRISGKGKNDVQIKQRERSDRESYFIPPDNLDFVGK